MSFLTFENLLTSENYRVIFRTVWGSHAYGTNTPSSDRDTMGVFVMEKSHYLTASEPIKQLSDERNDNRFYTLKWQATPIPIFLIRFLLRMIVYFRRLRIGKNCKLTGTYLFPNWQAKVIVNMPFLKSKKPKDATNGFIIRSRLNFQWQKISASLFH